MPITIGDFTAPETSNTDGALAGTMGAFTASMSGSSVNAPPDVDGALNRAMDPFTARFRDGEVWPLLGTVRIGSRNYTQSGAESSADRVSMGLFDAVLLGGFFGTDQDSTTPGPNFIAREEVTQDILDVRPTDPPYVFTYLNQMETGQSSSFAAKINSETGPNGTDWWFRDSTGAIVVTGFGSLINITNQVTPDSEGRRFPQWYVDTRVQDQLINPHLAAGIGFGKGGINGWWDNLGIKVRKSDVDPDQNGTSNDMQQWFDADDASHMSGTDTFGAQRSSAVAFAGEYRSNQIDALERISAANPGFLFGGNTNQWDDVDGTYIIREYRTEFGNINSPAKTNVGLSENNTWGPSNFPRSGVWSNGDFKGGGNTWSASYLNIHLISWNPGISSPNIVFSEWEVECITSNSFGPGGNAIWTIIPDPNSAWDMFRWGFVTSCLANAYPSITGNKMGGTDEASTSGRRHVSCLFDEYGLINGTVDYGWGSGSTKLYRKWMGKALEDPPDLADINADGSYTRQFENCIVILNPNNRNTTAPITIDVSALAGGGASEYTRFLGTQDPATNDGTDLSSDFTMNSHDALVAPRKSWYDAL